MSSDEIIRLIGKIRERYDQIHEPSGNIENIEIDLLKADIRELYDKISLLAKPQPPVVIHQLQHDVVAAQTHTPAVTPQQQHREPEPSEPEPQTYEEPVSEIQKPTEAVPTAPLQTPASHPVSEPFAAVHVHEPVNPVHSTFDLFGMPATTLADKYKDEKRSINEKLNLETSADKSIGSRLRLKITDLRAAIGINDRFIFINELFEGDMRTYDELLGRLNSCNSIQDATDLFNQAKTMHGWSDDLNSVERLFDFIHRRYA